MMEAGPPQAAPNYWPSHTQPTPGTRGGKITSISAPTFGSIITPQWAELQGRETKLWPSRAVYSLVGGREAQGRMRLGSSETLPLWMQITEGVACVIHKLSPL